MWLVVISVKGSIESFIQIDLAGWRDDRSLYAHPIDDHRHDD